MGHNFSKSKKVNNQKLLTKHEAIINEDSIIEHSENSFEKVPIVEPEHDHNEGIILVEAWDEVNTKHLPESIEKIIEDYANYDFDVTSEKSYLSFTLFKKLLHKRDVQLASETAKHMLLGNVTKVRTLIEENPSIIYCRIPEVVDPVERKILFQTLRDDLNCKDPGPAVLYKNKTLLQIAAAEGYFAFARREGGYSNGFFPNPKIGIFEYILKKLPFVEACIQYNEQFPKEYLIITKNRLQAYRDAYKTFLLSIAKIEIPSAVPLEIIMNQNCELSNTVLNLRIAFAHASSREVTIGLRFSMQVVLDFINDLKDCNFNNTKTKVCAIMVYGLFQELALASDAHMLKTPKHCFVNKNFCEDINESLSDYYSSGLGETYFINHHGAKKNYQSLVGDNIFSELYHINSNILGLAAQKERAHSYFSENLDKEDGNYYFMEMHHCRPCFNKNIVR